MDIPTHILPHISAEDVHGRPVNSIYFGCDRKSRAGSPLIYKYTKYHTQPLNTTQHRAPQTRIGYFEGAKLLAFVPNSDGGLQHLVCLLSTVFTTIIPNSGGDLWWFALICVRLWWAYSQIAYGKLCTRLFN